MRPRPFTASSWSRWVGMPNFSRDEIRDLIGKGKSDKEIWDALLKDRGPLMLKPHLLP